MSAITRTTVVAAVIAFGCPPSPAVAQQSRPTEASKWEVEVHAGGLFGTNATGGKPISEFPVGASVPTSALNRTTRAVSSWYFGDGALLLNQVNTAFGVGARMTPLDAAIKQRLAERHRGGSVGFRAGRELTRRFAAEFNFDYGRAPLRMTADAEKAIEDSRASFAPAWIALLATGNTFNRNVTSTSELEAGDGHQIFATGALNIRLGEFGRLQPYVTVGGGGVFSRGTSPRASLTGNYRFDFTNLTTPFPMDETDRVTVRVAAPGRAFVGVLGGGFRYLVSPRQGIRADVRLHLGGGAVDTLVDATPSVAVRTPIFAINTPTTPAIQFSNNPQTSFQSSLSGPAVDGLRTFVGEGLGIQMNVTAGYFFRFGPATPPARRASGARRTLRGPAGDGGNWEVEGHGGSLGASDVTSGTAIEAFAAGANIPSLPPSTTRAVSSWYFGDGPVLISQVHGAMNRPSRITPLDGVLTHRLAKRGGGGSIGFRLGRQLTPRFSAEFNFDRAASSLALADEVESALEATRSSFIPVFRAAFPTGDVTSVLELERGGGHRQRLVTAALSIHLGTFGRVAPYATAGAGSVFNDGVAPTATLIGHYRFSPIATVVWDESDTVTVHAVIKDRAFVSVLGGGARIYVSSRHGVRADLRVHLTDNLVDTTVDARPSRGPGGSTGALFILSTNPTLQFASGPTGNLQSSLSGPAVDGLKTFTASGTQKQVNFSIGYFFRF